MFQYCLLFLFTVIILQPVTIIVGFIGRFLWHPPKYHPEFTDINNSSGDYDKKNICLEKMYTERNKQLNKNKLLTNGDCAKFLGMYYWATDDEYYWNQIMLLCDKEHKCFHRTPIVENPAEEVQFSTDMLSGFLGAIAYRMCTYGLTDSERDILGTIWDYSSFEKWPMLLNHQTQGKTFGRGFVWEPWRVWDTMKDIRHMLWLYLGYKITNKKRYLVAYWLNYILLFPMFMISVHDCSVFIGRFFALATHGSHSGMICAAAGTMLTKSWLFKHIFKRHYNRRRYFSPDTLALYNRYIKELTSEEKDRMEALIYSTYQKGTKELIKDTKYLDFIWPPKFTTGGKYIYPTSYRGNDYTDERSLITGRLYTEEERMNWSVDVIFPAGITLNK